MSERKNGGVPNGTAVNGNGTGKTTKLLRTRDVLERTTLSKATLGRLIREGLFPPGCRRGRQHPLWPDYHLDAWILSRMEARAKRRLAEPVVLPEWGVSPQANGGLAARGIQMLRRAQVEERVGMKKTKLYDLVLEGAFPAPVPLSESRRAWAEHEIAAWIQNRVDDSRDDDEDPASTSAQRF